MIYVFYPANTRYATYKNYKATWHYRWTLRVVMARLFRIARNKLSTCLASISGQFRKSRLQHFLVSTLVSHITMEIWTEHIVYMYECFDVVLVYIQNVVQSYNISHSMCTSKFIQFILFFVNKIILFFWSSVSWLFGYTIWKHVL